MNTQRGIILNMLNTNPSIESINKFSITNKNNQDVIPAKSANVIDLKNNNVAR